MATFAQNYANALSEFESLAQKRAATLKNKGKEQGVKKLAMLFKSGKTLEQRCADLDKALAVQPGKTKGVAGATAAAKAVSVAQTKLGEGLKVNIAEFKKQAVDVSPADNEMKAGFEVFLKRMEQLRHGAKAESELKIKSFQDWVGKGPTGDAKFVAEARNCYLAMKKGCDETEALAKMALARTTQESVMSLLSSSTGPRSINAAITTWKNLVRQRPGLPADVQRAGGADPVNLMVNPIMDATMSKNLTFWQNQFQMSTPGWEGRAKTYIQAMLVQVGHFRKTADAIKATVA